MSFAIDMSRKIQSSRVRETEGKNPFLQRSLSIINNDSQILHPLPLISQVI